MGLFTEDGLLLRFPVVIRAPALPSVLARGVGSKQRCRSLFPHPARSRSGKATCGHDFGRAPSPLRIAMCVVGLLSVWLTVPTLQAAEALALQIETLTVPPSTQPLLFVAVQNRQDQAYSGSIAVKGPEGWRLAPASRPVTLAPAETKRVPFTIEQGTQCRSQHLYVRGYGHRRGPASDAASGDVCRQRSVPSGDHRTATRRNGAMRFPSPSRPRARRPSSAPIGTAASLRSWWRFRKSSSSPIPDQTLQARVMPCSSRSRRWPPRTTHLVRHRRAGSSFCSSGRETGPAVSGWPALTPRCRTSNAPASWHP